MAAAALQAAASLGYTLQPLGHFSTIETMPVCAPDKTCTQALHSKDMTKQAIKAAVGKFISLIPRCQSCFGPF